MVGWKCGWLIELVGGCVASGWVASGWEVGKVGGRVGKWLGEWLSECVDKWV